MLRKLLIVIVGLLVVTACSPIVTIQPDQVGVAFNVLTGDIGDPLMPGTHFVDPIADQITIYTTAQQLLTMADGGPDFPDDAIQVRFADTEEARIDLTVIYSLNPQMVRLVHQRWQERYAWDFLRPIARGVTRDVASYYTAEQVIGAARIDFENDIRTDLRARMEAEGLLLYDVLIRDIQFSQAFSDRIEQQQLATQNALQTATPAP